MSRLQEQTKPILVAMIEGKPISVTRDDQLALSAWAAMAIMVGEFFFPDAIAVPASDRLQVKDTQIVPNTWKIWAGCYRRENWRAHFARSTHWLLFPNMPDPAPSASAGPNTHATTLVVGNILFHAFACPYEPQTQSVFLEPKDSGVKQIWPPVAEFAWPTTPLSDDDAEWITNAIPHAIVGSRT